MTVISKTISLSTKGNTQVIDLTSLIAKVINEADIKNGLVIVFAVGSTAGVTTIEFEPGLSSDLASTFERISPEGISYQHDLRWHDGNGHSHIRAALLGSSLSIPIVDQKLVLGTWQQIVYVDFDIRPRSRKVIVQVIGE